VTSSHAEPTTAPDRPGTAAIEGRSISNSFGTVKALRDVSFKVRYGRVLTLLGDNGAGKSTLIKIITGVSQPDRGELLLDGQPIRFRNPREARKHGIATVFQDLAVCEMLSITRNVVLGNEPTRWVGPLRLYDAKGADRIARRALAGLGARINRQLSSNARTLSGGERQALAIARAMYYGSKCLILDEPTASLAARQAQGVLDHVRGAADAGQAVVLITHNYLQALNVADDVLVLARGSVVASFEEERPSLEELMSLVAR
jgi:simple sugar transport system ATP-binding protein